YNMYNEHFGLKYPPFNITPDTHLFYSGANRGLTLDALVYAVKNGEGIIKVVGEVGSGKTMLCRMLEEKLPKEIEVVYIANPSLPPEMILHAIALEMRLPVTPQENRLQVMHILHNHLLKKYSKQQQVVVFIEEAQGMPLETLEEIRLLSNLETTRNKLLQIVLFGQPELDVNLSANNIRQLKERITHNLYLEGLTKNNIQEYLQFRLHAVGYRGPPVFSPPAIRLLTKISNGLMRRINILADKALLAAFADSTHIILPKHIYLAAQDSGFSCPTRFNKKGFIGVILIIFIGMLIPDKLNTWLNTADISNINEIVETTENTKIAKTIKVVEPIDTSSVSVKDTITQTTSPLQQRLKATEKWLLNQQYYTIQIIQVKVDRTDYLQKFLNKPEIKPLLNDLYIYRTDLYWEIMYSKFVDTKEAMAEIENLPERLQRNKPFLRKIVDVKK
ncbi:AAA family ATPase, partial [Candidatus Halobeggiatoa sp. HSG11]|nr:AAA family ATPase [Candidatus Halobeggiatoa sp. HSG11]